MFIVQRVLFELLCSFLELLPLLIHKYFQRRSERGSDQVRTWSV